MKQRILKAMDFMRLLDESGALSLSNVALMVMIVKIALSKGFDMASAALLIPVLGNYAAKRYFQNKNKVNLHTAADLNLARLDAVINDVERLKLASGFKNVTDNIRKGI